MVYFHSHTVFFWEVLFVFIFKKIPKSNLFLDVNIIFNIIHTEILSMRVEQCHIFNPKMYHVKLGKKMDW